MILVSYLVPVAVAAILIRYDLKKRAEDKKTLEQLEFESYRNN